MLATNLQHTLHRTFKCNKLFHIHHKKNGVVKREYSYIKRNENCIIQSKGLSSHFWVEAIICANYIVLGQDKTC
jgi:hypothetical protein